MEAQGIIVDVWPIMQFISKWKNTAQFPRNDRDCIRAIIKELEFNKRLLINKIKVCDLDKAECGAILSSRNFHRECILSRRIRLERLRAEFLSLNRELKVVKHKIKTVNKLLTAYDDVNRAEIFYGDDIIVLQIIHWCHNLIETK